MEDVEEEEKKDVEADEEIDISFNQVPCKFCATLYFETIVGLCDACLSLLDGTPPSPVATLTPDDCPTSIFSNEKQYRRTLTTEDYLNVGGEDDTTHPVWSNILKLEKFEKDPTIIPYQWKPKGKFKKND